MTMLVRGLLPVIPTPFVAGAFDPGSFGRMLDHMLPALDGYTLLGSTGEAPSLSTRERMEIAEAALAMTPADKTVVVGISHTSADESIALARHAHDHGAAAVLCSAPYYFDNCAAGLLAYFRTLAANSSSRSSCTTTRQRRRPSSPRSWYWSWRQSSSNCRR